MAKTIVAVDPDTRSGGLLVEVHSSLLGPVPSQMFRQFDRRLYEQQMIAGLLVTPDRTYVVRDLFTGDVFEKNSYTRDELSTSALFSRVGLAPPAKDDELLVTQVLDWLDSLVGSWEAALPESAVGAMVPEVVGNLAHAELRVLDGVLETHAAVA